MADMSLIAGTADTQADRKPRLSEAALRYAETQRKISRGTLEALGTASGTVFFPTLTRKSEAVVFPYTDGGEMVNWKAAAFPEKAYTSKAGGRMVFLNLDRIRKSETVFITEGEWDAAALVEAGVPVDQVTSVPNGARERRQDAGDEPRGYDYVIAALESGLNRAKRFVFCGDADGPGHALRHDMARIIGPARFWFVDWPEGVKDANDMLRTDGPAALLDLVTNGALPWPAEGLYRMDDLPEPPALILWQPGFAEWESKVMLAPRTMSIVTGHPGHGKTHLWGQIWQQVASRYDLVVAAASFETRAKPHKRRQLRTLLSGKLEVEMTDAERKVADAWINAHYLWLEHPDQRPTLGWFLDTAEAAVARHGARVLQLDPWNRLEHNRPQGISETDYIGDCLAQIYVFAQHLNCHVQIVAHPAKMDGYRRTHPPELEDISGSKNWDNRADQGFVVHRPVLFQDGRRMTEANLLHKKARFEELGYPCQLGLDLNLKTGRYESTDYRQQWEKGGRT